MSGATHGDGQVELTCSVGDLRVTISGPPDQATELLRKILQLGSSQRAESPAASVGSFDLISARAPDSPPPVPARHRETRAQIEASFADCPTYLLRQSNKLSGSSVGGIDRIKRAWRAGQWGGATVAGRVGSPSRSVQLDLRPRFYVVLKASGLAKPTLFSSATGYWKAIGVLEGSSSVSHAFPSELEAQAYLAGAGIEDFVSSN